MVSDKLGDSPNSCKFFRPIPVIAAAFAIEPCDFRVKTWIGAIRDKLELELEVKDGFSVDVGTGMEGGNPSSAIL